MHVNHMNSWNGMIPRLIHSARFLILLVAIGSMTNGARAQTVAKTPLPEYTGRPVTVSEVPDSYSKIVTRIEQVNQETGASFYLVVVRSSGRGTNATRSYADDLFRAWSKSPAGKSSKFDPERSVLIVVAVDNRQIATHAGTEIRSRYGLDPATITNELVKPRFVPLATELKYEEGMIALLDGFQEKITGTRPHRDRGIVDSLPTVVATSPPTTTPVAVSVAGSTGTGRQLVWALLASLAAVVAIVFGLVWLGRRRVNHSVSQQLKGVKGQAVDAMDRLDALKERHKLLPAASHGYTEPMTGQTLELFNAIKEKLDALWGRWLEVMDKIDKAQKLIGAGSALSLGNQKSRQAEEILSKEIKFPEIEAEAQACSADLDRLEKAHDEVRAAIQSFAESQAKLKSQVESVEKAGLPTTPYQPDLKAIEGLGTQADALVVADPIGSEGLVEKAKARVDGQIVRAGEVLALLVQSQTIERSLKQVERATAAQRTKGFKLHEEGGNPDPVIAEGLRRQGLGLAALQVGDPTVAKTELAEADAQAKQAQQILDAVVQAKASCQREGPARTRETTRLRDAFGEAKNYRDELQREFAPASWDGVSRNLDQAKALMDTFDRKSAEAAAEGSDAKQNYLLGARLFEELGRQQQIALRLMAGLGEQVNTLVGIRKEVQDLKRQLDTTDRKVGSLFEQNGEVVSAQAQGLFDSARRDASNVAAKLDDTRPDWPAIRDELKQMLEEYGIAQTRAEADLNAYQSFVGEIDGARRDAARVESFLGSRTEDRPAANRRFRTASKTLEQLANNPGSGRDWQESLQAVRDAASDIQAAERLANEDIRLAAQAESEIAQASATIQQATGAVGMGIVANTSEAEAKLGQAQQLLGSQNYEQAIAQAEAAFQSARSAYNTATQQIFFQQMQYDAERRRQAASEMARASYRGPSAGSIAAASAAASILGRMVESAGWHGGSGQIAESIQGSSDYSDQGRENSPDEGTSVSSWETNSSQSDW